MTQQAFYFDGTRCTGCKTCVYACKDKNNTMNTGLAHRKVIEYTGGETNKDEAGCITTSCFSYTVSVSCNHCDNPVCMEMCPQGAIYKDPDTGIVWVNQEECIGCGTCATACPYGAPHVDPEAMKAVRCDGCADLVAAGEKPACVLACPARALDFGDVDAMAAKGERANIAPLPSADTTGPNLYIKAPGVAKEVDSTEGVIGNPLEIA